MLVHQNIDQIAQHVHGEAVWRHKPRKIKQNAGLVRCKLKGRHYREADPAAPEILPGGGVELSRTGPAGPTGGGASRCLLAKVIREDTEALFGLKACLYQA